MLSKQKRQKSTRVEASLPGLDFGVTKIIHWNGAGNEYKGMIFVSFSHTWELSSSQILALNWHISAIVGRPSSSLSSACRIELTSSPSIEITEVVAVSVIELIESSIRLTDGDLVA